MKIEVLISTMHQKKGDYSLLERMNIQTCAIVVNQCNYSSIDIFQYKGNRIKWINTLDRGLSKSRNLALENSKNDICIIADDDEVFVEGYEKIIQTQFEENRNADLIQFKVEGIESTFKEYPKYKSKLNYFTSMKISSVEIAFKRNRIIDNGLFFNELIGAGTDFMMGEENTFCWECLKKKLQIFYVPMVIANLHIGNSTWFNGYNIQYFIGKGAAFAAMSQSMSILLILQFSLRKWYLYHNSISMISVIKFMYVGRKQYFNKLKNKKLSNYD